MKQAKASEKEWQALVDWFNKREEKGKEVPDWRRVVFSYEVLVSNTCDPEKDYLDWKPEILKLMAKEKEME